MQEFQNVTPVKGQDDITSTQPDRTLMDLYQPVSQQHLVEPPGRSFTAHSCPLGRWGWTPPSHPPFKTGANKLLQTQMEEEIMVKYEVEVVYLASVI